MIIIFLITFIIEGHFFYWNIRDVEENWWFCRLDLLTRRWWNILLRLLSRHVQATSSVEDKTERRGVGGFKTKEKVGESHFGQLMSDFSCDRNAQWFYSFEAEGTQVHTVTKYSQVTLGCWEGNVEVK